MDIFQLGTKFNSPIQEQKEKDKARKMEIMKRRTKTIEFPRRDKKFDTDEFSATES